jgi:hypothetical protein
VKAVRGWLRNSKCITTTEEKRRPRGALAST